VRLTNAAFRRAPGGGASAEDEAERVADRVGEDPEALLASGRQAAGAERQDRLFRLVDVVHPDVQVQLLGVPRVGPPGRHERRRRWKASSRAPRSRPITTQSSLSSLTRIPSSSA
jgi:hypothetical protein